MLNRDLRELNSTRESQFNAQNLKIKVIGCTSGGSHCSVPHALYRFNQSSPLHLDVLLLLERLVGNINQAILAQEDLEGFGS
jgi:hypothetical protein